MTASTQRAAPSVPAPNPWISATGQHRYPAQCTMRQARTPIRTRSRLVTSTASSRSNAIAPRPSQIRRYGEENGTTVEMTLIEA